MNANYHTFLITLINNGVHVWKFTIFRHPCSIKSHFINSLANTTLVCSIEKCSFPTTPQMFPSGFDYPFFFPYHAYLLSSKRSSKCICESVQNSVGEKANNLHVYLLPPNNMKITLPPSTHKLFSTIIRKPPLFDYTQPNITTTTTTPPPAMPVCSLCSTRRLVRM